MFNLHIFTKGVRGLQPVHHTHTQQVTVYIENVNNTRPRCIQGEIMPNSHEGRRDRCKLLILEGAPSQVGRRQESCVLGCRWEHLGASGTREQPGQTAPWVGVDVYGEGPPRLEKTKWVKNPSPRGTACSKDSGAQRRVIQSETKASSGSQTQQQVSEESCCPVWPARS